MHLTGTPLLLLGNKVAYLYPRCAYAYSSKTCYTNLPSAGAMRGYGAPQVVFAVESMLDDAATALGIDPVEIRLRNAAREGDANPLTGKRIYSAGLPECLEKAGKSLNGKNAVQSARTSKAIYVVALASPVLATPLTPACRRRNSRRAPVDESGWNHQRAKRRDGNRPVPTPCSRKWWQKPWEFRSAMFTLFQPKIPTLHHSTPAHLPHVRAMLPRLLRSAALLLKRKSSLTPQSCYISQR